MPVDRIRNIKSLTSDAEHLHIDPAKAEEVYEIETGEDALNKFIANAKKFRNYPPAQFTYHAYSNVRTQWTPERIMPIVEFARKRGLEVRAWCNEMSAMNLVVVKDPDNSEDSGMELYEAMQGKYDAYGLASWYEFEKFGVPVYIGEDTQVERFSSDRADGMWIGKSKEDCVTLW